MANSNYINDEFTINIKQWIDIDTKIQTLNEDLKKLRETRNSTGTFITKYIESHNLTKTKFSLNNGYIKCYYTVPVSYQEMPAVVARSALYILER